MMFDTVPRLSERGKRMIDGHGGVYTIVSKGILCKVFISLGVGFRKKAKNGEINKNVQR